MISYFFPFILLSLFHFVEFFRNNKNLKFIMLIIASLILILFAGLREVGVGTDDFNYYNIFNDIPSLTEIFFENTQFHFDDYHKEYGYIFINIFIKNFTTNYTVLFILIAFIAVGLNTYNYKKYSSFIFLSLLLYFVHTYLYRDLNQIRAGVATAIGLFTITQIHKKEHLKFFFTLFIASLFHIAVLSLMLPYIISFFKIDRNRGILIFIIGVFFGVIGISSIIINFLPSELGSAAQSLNNYAQSQTNSRDLGMFNITNIKSLFIFILLLIFYTKLENKVKYFNILFLFYALAVSWRFAFSDFAILSGRIATFFEIVEVILIPSFLLILRQKILGSFLIILYAFLILYLNVYTTGRQPYEMSIF